MPVRRSRPLPRLDLTPFVGVAFLLITFFMWIKTTERSQTIPLQLPNKAKYDITEYPVPEASILLLANNRIGFLTYQRHRSRAEYVETDYSAGGLRRQLLWVKTLAENDHPAIVLITPSEQATFGNLVDVVDELRTLRPLVFRLNYSLLPDERRLLKTYQRYVATHPAGPVVLKLPLYGKPPFGGSRLGRHAVRPHDERYDAAQ